VLFNPPNTRDVLGRTYGLSGLTAILVLPDGMVTSVVHALDQPVQLKQLETGLGNLGSAAPVVR